MSTTQTLYSFTQEDQFLARMNSEVAALWQQQNEGFYRAFDKKKVYWCSLTNPNHTKAIVMVNGRIESTWKYQELFFDLYQNGYDIYSFDHRGQGLSQRLIDNIEMGHVGEFNDYITDLIALLELFDLEKYKQRFYLVTPWGRYCNPLCANDPSASIPRISRYRTNVWREHALAIKTDSHTTHSSYDGNVFHSQIRTGICRILR